MGSLPALAFSACTPLQARCRGQFLTPATFPTCSGHPQTAARTALKPASAQCIMMASSQSRRRSRVSTVEGKEQTRRQSSAATRKREEPLVKKKTGMNTAVVLSEELQEFCGTDMMRRSQVLSHLSSYIKENGLYVAGNRKKFVCDDKLQKLLNVSGEHALLGLHKLLGPHVKHPSDCGPEYEERADRMFADYLKSIGALDRASYTPAKHLRAKNSYEAQKELHRKGEGMYAAVEIPPTLRPICGGKTKLSRPQILKSIWDYIKKHQLQDAERRRQVNFDTMLGDALQVGDMQSVDCFQLSGLVWKHCK